MKKYPIIDIEYKIITSLCLVNQKSIFPVRFNILGINITNKSMMHILSVTHGTLLRMGQFLIFPCIVLNIIKQSGIFFDEYYLWTLTK